MKRRRERRLAFRPELLMQLFQEGHSCTCITGLPPTVKFRGVGFDAERNAWWIYIEDKSFPKVAEDQVTPEHPAIQFRRVGEAL